MAQEVRAAELFRTTKETDIALSLDIDGTGKTNIETGVAFFDHMLDAFGRHGLFDLTVKAKGDIEVDAHHTVEDVGIVLGKAFAQAMGEKRGITRFASQYLPMDETLVLAAVDISGRGQLHWDVDVPLCLLVRYFACQGILHCICDECAGYAACAHGGRRKRPPYRGSMLQGGWSRYVSSA